MTAPVMSSFSHGGGSSNSAIVIDYTTDTGASGMSLGDTLVVTICDRSNETLGLPTGWVLAARDTQSGFGMTLVMTKLVDNVAADASSHVFTTSSAHNSAFIARRVTGGDTDSPFVDEVTINLSTGARNPTAASSASVSNPSVASSYAQADNLLYGSLGLNGQSSLFVITDDAGTDGLAASGGSSVTPRAADQFQIGGGGSASGRAAIAAWWDERTGNVDPNTQHSSWTGSRNSALILTAFADGGGAPPSVAVIKRALATMGVGR